MIELFSIDKIALTKYLFFTGKGGVGKTSIACSIAVNLADKGKRTLLISTDPASNLQDVFQTEISGKALNINEIPLLEVVNIDPEEAAANYKESVVSPYRGKLPDNIIANMEEQLSGSCTVEIAAFDQFSKFITDPVTADKYDYIVFDTAPTGHTLRMLQLPSAWTSFISESTHGASCLGQLAGLESKKNTYAEAVKNLASHEKTTLFLVARPETVPLLEVSRTSSELLSIGINNQIIIVNGLLENADDELSTSIFEEQEKAISSMPKDLESIRKYFIPLRSYNLLGIENLRSFFSQDLQSDNSDEKVENLKTLQNLIDDMFKAEKKLIFTMGKGGVGKTSVASAIAQGLAEKGAKVLLTTTDPANHIMYEKNLHSNITVSSIDEEKELEKYREEVLSKARETMNEDDIAYIEEDLRSPCTQEIAVFRAFAEIVYKSNESIVVIDTAPTGHTLLLLDSTLSYHKEVERTKGEVPVSVQKLLPLLRDESHTDVVIVTLPEATPVFEAQRLRVDLERAGIKNKWWVVNKSFLGTQTENKTLHARAENEKTWINKANAISKENCALIGFKISI